MQQKKARRWLPIVLVVLGGFMVCVTFMLGRWQDARAQFKTNQYALEQTRKQLPELRWGDVALLDGDMANLHHRNIELFGQFLSQGVLYIDNRQVNGAPAIQVIQAFQPDGATFVIPVERGYMLRNPAIPRALPSWQAANSSKQYIRGVVVPGVTKSAEWRGFWFSSDAAPIMQQVDGRHLWSNYSRTHWAHTLGLPVANWVLRAAPEPKPADLTSIYAQSNAQALSAQKASPIKLPGQYNVHPAPLVWPVAAKMETHPADKHRAYALQWYGLSIAAAVTCLILLWKERQHGQ